MKDVRVSKTIYLIYMLFLRWGCPLITYNGEIYFCDKEITDVLSLDMFADERTRKFLNKYGVVDKKSEQDRYSKAKTIRVCGEKVI